MSFILEHSCIADKPELDLFTNAPTQAAAEEGFYVEHLPTTSLDDQTSIKFSISGDSNYYISLADSYMQAEVKITNNDGTDIAADAVVGPVNLLAHSMFKQVDIYLNDTLITDSSNLYHYRSMIETLLSYGSDAKKSQLSLALYDKDKAGEMNNIANANTGLVNRRAFTSSSQVVPLIFKLHSDMFFQHRYLINGVDIKIKMVKNENDLVLMAANDATFKLKIVNASFFLRKIKINPGLQLKHIEKMDKQLKPAIYPIRRVSMKSYNIANGSLSSNEENLFSGVLPKRIVIGLVNAANFEGAYNKNPFNFEHCNLKYCSLVVDGKLVPQKPLSSDFANHNTLRNYFSLYDATGKAFKDQGTDISRSEYEQGYSLIAFDLTPDLMDGDNCYHVIKKGNIRLELKFSQALPNPVNVVVYGEYDSAIKIDKNRSVITDFYN